MPGCPPVAPDSVLSSPTLGVPDTGKTCAAESCQTRHDSNINRRIPEWVWEVRIAVYHRVMFYQNMHIYKGKGINSGIMCNL